MKQGGMFTSAVASVLIALPVVGYSGTISQTVNNGFGLDWNDALWGTPAVVPVAGDDYVTVAGLMTESDSRLGALYSGRVRSDDSADTTFAGNSITIAGGTELLLKQSGNQLTIGNIILDGGVIRLSAGNACKATLAGSLYVLSESFVGVSDYQMPELTISSALNGDGVLHLAAGVAPGIIRFTGDLSGFTGILALGGGDSAGTYDFDQDYDLSAVDIVVHTNNAEILNLDQDIIVHNFIFGNEPALEDGIYSAADLNALYGNGSQFAGSGSLTIVPKPVYQTVNNGFGLDWNDALWGTPAVVPVAGKDYITVAGLMSKSDSRLGASYSGRVRSDDSADTTFAGNSITIAGGTELLLKQSGNQLTSGNIILDGGIIRLSAGNACKATLAGSLYVLSESYVGVSDYQMPELTISSALNGDGVLHLAAGVAPGIIRFTGDLSGFTGTLALGGGDSAGTYDFDQDYDLSAVDIVVNADQSENLNLDQDITVGSFTFGNSISLHDGTYTVDDLNQLYGNGYQFTGEGSLTVGLDGWSEQTGPCAGTIAGAYSSAFYVQNGTNAYFRNKLSGGVTYFWSQAEIIETIIDAYEWSGDAALLEMSANLLHGFVQHNGSDWSGNMYNDDVIWAVLAFVRVAQHTGNSYYANIAKSNFDMCYARGWDTTDGGMYWTTDNRSKNACANGNTAIAAYLLYQLFGDSAYLDKANAVYDWERAVLFNPESGAVYDNIGSTGSINTWSSSYNQGAFIGAAHFLGHIEDANLAAYYTMTRLCINGVLRQYGTASNNSGFNAIFLRWMTRFMNDRGLQDQYGLWLKKNAVAAWNVRRADNLSWCQWREPTAYDVDFYAWDCVSSYSALFAAYPTPAQSPFPVPRYPVGCWPLDGMAEDVSGNDRDGVVNNGTWSSNGHVNGCLTFNGIDSSMQVTNTLRNDFSIAFWVKTTQTTTGTQWYNGTGLVDADVPFTGDDFGTALLNDRFAFGIGNPDVTIQSVSAINDGNWHQCVATRKQATGAIRIYVDGRLEAAGAGSCNTLDSPTTLLFGKTGSHYFNGSLDEVQVFTRTLGSDEVAALYYSNTYLPMTAPSTLASVAGDARVSLQWADAAGATSYNIKRSLVTGGPYTTITNVTATEFVDTGLANNRTYYYVVSGVNAIGEGPDSAEDYASPTALVAWFNADMLTGLGDGASLAVWKDSSGNGNDAVQSVDIHRPTVATNSMNGKSVVRFNAVDESCLWLNRPVQDDFTLFLVYRSTQGIGTGTDFYQGAGLLSGEMPGVANDFGVTLNANGQVLAGVGNPETSIHSASGFNDGQPHVITFQRIKSTGSVQLYLDGALVSGQGGTQSLTSPNVLLLGANPVLNNFLSGDIAEVRIYNAALSSADRIYLESALMGSYGIPGGGLPGVPTDFTGLADNGQVLLNWTMAPGAYSYNLWRSTDGGASYILIGTDLIHSSYVDAAAAVGQDNLYRLAGVNDSGIGAQTSPLTVYLPGSQVASKVVLSDPELMVTIGADAMEISWPEWASDWVLYCTTNLASPTSWVPMTNGIEISEGQFLLSIPLDSSCRFFRLDQP